MSDKLPERTFAPGMRVWTPSAGFCVLSESAWPDCLQDPRRVLYTKDGRHAVMDGALPNVSRSILNIVEAKALGLEMPKVKRKMKVLGFLNKKSIHSLIAGHAVTFESTQAVFATEDSLVSPELIRAPWLDGEVDVEVEGDE